MPGKVNFDLGVEEYDKVIVSFAKSPPFELFLFSGTPSEISERLTEITGRPFELPDWALGHQVSRFTYFPQSSVTEIIEDYTKEFPVSALYLDIDYMNGYRIFTWDRESFRTQRLSSTSVQREVST
ncbi:hypothetical protein [Thermogymnomonas acidicola]|uniref:TIM-barrel domain-containing protein n=1 Tax=Thermogymnomonas acidicola TaxID=399579 RepID=UPI001396C8BE|nr:TIM-barrel domain-containing protein [Thermogymnomonas acidicola]